MDTNKTKWDFANLCDRICTKLRNEYGTTPDMEVNMRRIVSQLAMVAWNTCIISKSLEEAKAGAMKMARPMYGDSIYTEMIVSSAASIKWHDYIDDTAIIASISIETDNGQPKTIAHLKGERPGDEAVTAGFQKFMNSPEVQERLRNISPDKIDDEIRKIVAEYNANLPPVSQQAALDAEGDEDVPDELLEHPISRDTLEQMYQRTLWEIPLRHKKETMKEILKEQPFLAPLCKGHEEDFRSTERKLDKGKIQSYPGSVPEMIITIMAVYYPSIDFSDIDKDFVGDFNDAANLLVKTFMESKDDLHDMVGLYEEPNLIEFICEHVSQFKLPEKMQRKTMRDLLAWGLAIETLRIADDEDYFGEEEYDFDLDKIRVFQLRVDLLGYDVTADVQVREDMTFQDLHLFLNSLFRRDDDHLYRFECDDGLIAIHPDEECDDEDEEDDEDRCVIHADECFLGHHLTLRNGTFYIFDYGDEWEHNIMVKKILDADPKAVYPKVINITGEIPEQYPDDEDDED